MSAGQEKIWSALGQIHTQGRFPEQKAPLQRCKPGHVPLSISNDQPSAKLMISEPVLLSSAASLSNALSSGKRGSECIIATLSCAISSTHSGVKVM